MEWLFGTAEPFVGHAGRAFGVALAILLLYALARLIQARRPGISARSLLVAAGAWGVFGALEAEATREKADIRVDLLLTWPLVCLVTLVCVALWVWRIVARRT